MRRTLQIQGALLTGALGVAVLILRVGCGKTKPDTVDLGGEVKMELVRVPAGRFQMGSDDHDTAKRVHTVKLDGFWMGRFEVTQEQYEAVMGSNPSNFRGAKNPVEQVSWDDAMEFCRRVSRKTGKQFRLPMETEWVYACRAGSKTRFCFGDSDRELGDYAWYAANSGAETHPVGGKKPNEWGLYDMHGNVWEWCKALYGEKYYGDRARYYWESDGKNPQGPSNYLLGVVVLGGSWQSPPDNCYATNPWQVYSIDARDRYYSYGFRVVCGGPSSR